MAAGKSATSTRSVSLAQNPKEPKRSRGSKQGMWSKQWSRRARNRESTLDGCWYERPAHLTSARAQAACRESAIGSVRRFIAAMAIATRWENGMDKQAPPRPPPKERAIPPPDESRGHPGAAVVVVWVHD